MSDFLAQIVSERRADIVAIRASARERVRPAAVRIPDRFTAALLAAKARRKLAVIAEVKRRSPAMGELGRDADVVALARSYESAGACAISVLTEPRHWGGSLDDLRAVREAVRIPVLRKDVILDVVQLEEAADAGADAVLLIAEALDEAELQRLVTSARGLGLGALVEAHEPLAFARATAAGSRVVGVNARDLRHPERIDPRRVVSLQASAREDQVLVAESGIASVADARALPERVDAVLVGTALMRADDPAPLVAALSAIEREPAVVR